MNFAKAPSGRSGGRSGGISVRPVMPEGGPPKPEPTQPGLRSKEHENYERGLLEQVKEIENPEKR